MPKKRAHNSMLTEFPGVPIAFTFAPPESRLMLQTHSPRASVEEAINNAHASANSAYDVARDMGESDKTALSISGEAFRSHLPMLKNMDNIHAYIGVIAEGVAYKFIAPEEARVMLFAAELALAAFAKWPLP